MITVNNLVHHEFIGLSVSVTSVSNESFRLKGTVIDETKNTIKIEVDDDVEKIIPKKGSIFVFELPTGEKVEINDKGIFVDDEQVEEKDSTIEFTFENKKIEVPKTGDESKIKLFAGAIILSLLGITYIVIRNHNKNKQE